MRRILWGRLPDQRPGRELYWLSRMPDTVVDELGSPRTHPPESGIGWVPREFVRPVTRFVEAGAFGWLRGLGSVDATPYSWVASLELCALVTGQMSALAVRHRLRQAVVTWENLPRQPLYAIPPYAGATRRALGADLMVCPIEAARDHLLELGFPSDRIAVVPPGVDVKAIRPPEEIGIGRSENVIAFVSPLAPNKGIDRVMDAFDLVRRQQPDARLVIAGGGPLAGEVGQRAAASGGTIHYLGSVSRERVAEILAGAAVFTTAPRTTWKWNEQFGLAYVEAMAAGLPIVTTVCGTNEEAVRPPNLRTSDRADELAEGLLMFLRDPALARKVGLANREVAVREHDLSQQVIKLEAAFAAAEELPLRARVRGGRPL